MKRKLPTRAPSPLLPKGRYIPENSKLTTITGKFVNFSNSTANDLYLDHTANGPNSQNSGWIPSKFKVDDPELQKGLKLLNERFLRMKPMKPEIYLQVEYETQIGQKHVVLKFKELAKPTT